MSTFRFIHCSDLHIDSPFKGFSRIDPEWAERLRSATLRAFENIVDLAVDEAVDAVVIAGDIFDGADKSLQAQLKFLRALERLTSAGIPVFLAHGNHDPLNSWIETLRWPEGVHVFSGKQVDRVPVEKGGNTLAQIYGISFPKTSVTNNLALKFSRVQEEGFAVGVLHANVGGDANHDNYAPCSIDDLVGTGMDYWALGHIHAHRVLRPEAPAIVYCGNSQGRHVRETGIKGCCLVTLTEMAAPEIRFVATDVLRFAECEVDLSDCDTWDRVLSILRQKGQELLKVGQGRDLVVRVHLAGRTRVHGELQKPDALRDLQDEVLAYFEGETPGLWVELVGQTQGALDEAQLRQGQDFIADVIRHYDREENEGTLEEVREWLKPLYESWQGRRLLDTLTDEDIKNLLDEARHLTLDQLVGKET